MSHPVNWTAIGVIVSPLLTVLAAIGRWIAGKADRIGEHLERQDAHARRQEQRLIRVETKLGLNPMGENGDAG